MNKINFRKYWDKDGTVYTQTISLNMDIIIALNKAIKKQIARHYPEKKKYAQTSGNEIFFLKPLILERDPKGIVIHTNHTQMNFINLILKLKLKDRNTRLIARMSKRATNNNLTIGI